MKADALVAAFVQGSPALLLDSSQVAKHLKRAVRFYCGHATLTNGGPLADGIHSSIDAGNAIDTTWNPDLTPSEYAIIKPLFELYVEEESAIHLEASRSLGVDVFGRSVGEVRQAILEMETISLPRLAYIGEAETI